MWWDANGVGHKRTTRAQRGRCGAEAEAAVLCVRSGGGGAVAGQPAALVCGDDLVSKDS